MQLKSIHLTPEFKNFLTGKKNQLGLKYNRFKTIQDALIYYLKENDEFFKDYSNYCKTNNLVNEIVKTELEEQKIIMSYENKNNLRLLSGK